MQFALGLEIHLEYKCPLTNTQQHVKLSGEELVTSYVSHSTDGSNKAQLNSDRGGVRDIEHMVEVDLC